MILFTEHITTQTMDNEIYRAIDNLALEIEGGKNVYKEIYDDYKNYMNETLKRYRVDRLNKESVAIHKRVNMIVLMELSLEYLLTKMQASLEYTIVINDKEITCSIPIDPKEFTNIILNEGISGHIESILSKNVIRIGNAFFKREDVASIELTSYKWVDINLLEEFNRLYMKLHKL